MTDRQALEKLLRADSYLKQTKSGYRTDRPWWKRAMPLLWEVRQGLKPTHPEWGLMLAEAHGLLKGTEKGYDPRAPRWRAAMRLIDQVEENLRRPPVPDLGPIEPVGKSILLQQLSHETDGLFHRTGSRYPAWDFGWDAGDPILAPENVVVFQQSSAQGADAFFCRGVSTIEYWIGHVVSSPRNDIRFRKGELMARIAAIPGADHGHFGVNAKPLIGKDLLYGRTGFGPDYTWGAPTIGAQLTKEMML